MTWGLGLTGMLCVLRDRDDIYRLHYTKNGDCQQIKDDGHPSSVIWCPNSGLAL